MKYKFRRIGITYLFCIISFLLIINTVYAANPTIGEIKLEPANPAPQSEITISTDITGEDVSEVKIIISECNKDTGLCHISRNVSMNKKSGDTYEAKIMLQWDDVNTIKYQIILESVGKWIKSDEFSADLSMDSGDSNGSPGFESMVFLIAIVSFILLFKRFKSK